jgi:hypothetical protein
MSDKKKKNDEDVPEAIEHETRFGALPPWGGDCRPTARKTSVRKLRMSLAKKERSTLRGFDFR